MIINRAVIFLVALIFLMISTYNPASARELTIMNDNQNIHTNSNTINNSSFQSGSAIYGDRIVWENVRKEDRKRDIYSYNISTSTETRITASGSAFNPRIYGDRIVWQDNRDGNWNIYMYNLSTYKESQITTNGSAENPSTYGDKIVWIDSRNGWDHSDVYIYNLSTSKESQITSSGSAKNPVIYEDRILWDDYRNDRKYMVDSDIYMYNLSTNKEAQITTNGSNPDIYNDRIVWTDNRKGPGNSDIYMYYLSTSKETQITTSGSANFPATYKDKVVWRDNHNGNWDIYMYNISTSKETQITNNGSAWGPDINSDKIVWTSFQNESDIYVYNVSTSKEISIDFNKIYPNIIGRNGTGEIYVYPRFSWNPDLEVPLENANFTILGPDKTYVGNGSYWAKLDAITGKYKIIYEPVSGYETPISETKNLTEGDSINFNGNYLLKRRVGENLNFGDGYVLIIKQIDSANKEVIFELQLDGRKVDEAKVKEGEKLYFHKLSHSGNRSKRKYSPEMIIPENVSRDASDDFIDIYFSYLQYHAKPSTLLVINSIPEEAAIFVDGQYEGETSREIPIVNLKTYSVLLELKGYESWEGQRTFDKLEEQIIEANLTKTTLDSKNSNTSNLSIQKGTPDFMGTPALIILLCGYLILRKNK